MPLCRVPKKGTRQRRILPSAKKIALGKMPLCRVSKKRHSARRILLSAKKMALGKIHLCRVPEKGTRQRLILPSAEKKHSAKSSLPSAEKNTRQSRLCRVPDKIHSAKLPALGKVPVSGSVETDRTTRLHETAHAMNNSTHYWYRFFVHLWQMLCFIHQWMYQTR